MVVTEALAARAAGGGDRRRRGPRGPGRRGWRTAAGAARAGRRPGALAGALRSWLRTPTCASGCGRPPRGDRRWRLPRLARAVGAVCARTTGTVVLAWARTTVGTACTARVTPRTGRVAGSAVAARVARSVPRRGGPGPAGVAARHRPVRRRPCAAVEPVVARWPPLAVAAVTTVCCAWRWSVVARGARAQLVPACGVGGRRYRSQFLNATLPGGVLGDVHRGVRHGRDGGDTGPGVRSVVLGALRGPGRPGASWRSSCCSCVAVAASRAMPPPRQRCRRRRAWCSSRPWPSSRARRRPVRRRLARVVRARARLRAVLAPAYVAGVLPPRWSSWPGTRRPSSSPPRPAGVTVDPCRLLPLALLVLRRDGAAAQRRRLGAARGRRGVGVRRGRARRRDGGVGHRVRGADLVSLRAWSPSLRRRAAVLAVRPDAAAATAGGAAVASAEGTRRVADRPYTLLSCGMSIDGYLDSAGRRAGCCCPTRPTSTGSTRCGPRATRSSSAPRRSATTTRGCWSARPSARAARVARGSVPVADEGDRHAARRPRPAPRPSSPPATRDKLVYCAERRGAPRRASRLGAVATVVDAGRAGDAAPGAARTCTSAACAG